MNIKLKKFNILEPKVKITTGLKAIIFSDNNRFTIHQLVENVSKSASSEDMIFSIYSDKIEPDFDTYFATYYGSCQLGVYTIEFYDKFKYIDCGLYFYGSFTRRRGINEWYVNDTHSYTSTWYSADFLFNFYAYKEFTAHHPVYNNSEYLALGIEKKVHTVNRYKIGDVVNTKILSSDKAVIFIFSNGTYNLYKSDSSVDCTVTETSSNTYRFAWRSKRAVLDNLKAQKYTSKTDISYSDSTGSTGITPSSIILSTFDIYDTNGNLIFAKNANIEDYI